MFFLTMILILINWSSEREERKQSMERNEKMGGKKTVDGKKWESREEPCLSVYEKRKSVAVTCKRKKEK